jgi:Ca2+-transporting ATPase
LINAAIGFATERQAERTIRSLTESVIPPAIVIRDSQIQQKRADDLVPGDLLILKRGIYVTADARLVETRDLRVDESALTGESVAVDKNADVITRGDVPLADRRNMVFRGTLVAGGAGVAIVVATGSATEMGQIQLLVGDARAPVTPMEKQLDRLGTQLVYLCGGICAVVLLVGIVRGAAFLEMTQSALSLAVAAVPEGLPAVATTTLALGVNNMRRRRVLVRRLKAVETLGAVQALCFDKTGTLTINRMAVRAIHAGGRQFSVKDSQVWCNGLPVSVVEPPELFLLMQVGVLCTESDVTRRDRTVVVKGSSTENGLFQLAADAGLDVATLFENYPVVRVKERAEDRNYMATLHQSDTGRRFLAVKGNPEEVLALCGRQMRGGTIVPLTETDREFIRGENELMAAGALRVLGMAYMETDDGAELDDPHDLIWLGMTGMVDPLRTGVKELIATFHQAGIDTVMITGDQSLTADAVGKELGLSRRGDLVVLDSTQLNVTEPQVLNALVRNVDVFARVSPANKLHIIQSMQRGGTVVAMMGDGINDGPALKAADVGVAMGKTGTRAAREVADVLLEEDNLETMADAISLGRTIYGNIRKSIHYILATNLSEILVVSAAVGAGLGQPLTTRQLLWINLVSDIFPELALALEPPEPDVMHRPPRDPNQPVVGTGDFMRLGFEGGMIAAASLGAYGYGLARYGTGSAQAGTIGFMSLTSAQLLHALSCRSERYGVFSRERLPSNPYLNATLGVSLTLQALALAIPGLRSFLGLVPIGLVDAAVIGSAALAPLVVNEATKGAGR